MTRDMLSLLQRLERCRERMESSGEATFDEIMAAENLIRIATLGPVSDRTYEQLETGVHQIENEIEAYEADRRMIS